MKTQILLWLAFLVLPYAGVFIPSLGKVVYTRANSLWRANYEATPPTPAATLHACLRGSRPSPLSPPSCSKPRGITGGSYESAPPLVRVPEVTLEAVELQ
ncbi:MAG: hypothetical protein SGPRY_000419 [Prymnesium sp.]